MKKRGLFTREVEAEVTEESSNNNQFIDVELMKYVMDQFPQVAEEIKASLTHLRETLEKSIDYIEDKSSEMIKTTRDFELSGMYRDTSIKIHDISNDLSQYVEWIDDGICIAEEKQEREDVTLEKQENNEEISIEEAEDDSIKNSIFDDFTAKQPISFKIDNHFVEVESWDDMLVKTADVLTKHYKGNKHQRARPSSNIKPVMKKSKQNDFRDTIIDMLCEYHICLDNYKVALKQ